MHAKGPLAHKDSIITEDPGEPRQKAAKFELAPRDDLFRHRDGRERSPL